VPAAELLKGKQYALCICDLEMPGNQDLEFSRELPSLATGMPVILVTGYPSTETAIESIRLPVTAYLVKPFKFEKLLGEIHSSLQRSYCRAVYGSMQDRLESWSAGLERIRTDEDAAKSTGVESFVSLTLQNITGSLLDLKRLTDSLLDHKPEAEACKLMNCPRPSQFREVLADVLEVLERTKRSFESKELGDLRRRIELFLKDASLT
jgi:CheY-like chemotaxis protein